MRERDKRGERAHARERGTERGGEGREGGREEDNKEMILEEVEASHTLVEVEAGPEC